MCHNLTAIDEQVKTVLNATVFNMKIDRKMIHKADRLKKHEYI